MTHQPKGSMCISCGNANASCASRPFASMPVIKTYPDGVKAVKCTGHVHAQASTEKNEALQQVLVAALEEARSAINSMKVEAETAGQGDEQMMLEACETISNEGLQADMAIRAALASAPKPSSTPQADSQPALPKITAEDRSFLHYNPNTDDIVEWVCRYASAAITADRAARAQTDSVTAPAGGAVAEPEFDDCPASPTGKHSASWFANGDCEHCKSGAQPDAPLLYTPTPPTHAADSVLEDALTDSYVQQVPDKCDRIVWRGNYYHLPTDAARAQAKEGDPK